MTSNSRVGVSQKKFETMANGLLTVDISGFSMVGVRRKAVKRYIYPRAQASRVM